MAPKGKEWFVKMSKSINKLEWDSLLLTIQKKLTDLNVMSHPVDSKSPKAKKKMKKEDDHDYIGKKKVRL